MKIFLMHPARGTVGLEAAGSRSELREPASARNKRSPGLQCSPEIIRGSESQSDTVGAALTVGVASVQANLSVT